ncbi:MAG: hypothetical protein CVV05_15630 [Gammaproteobacteria bacterium HGW-Gammaproteobacteria-1]|jgi:diguanylate cyclase (GGDEF)-like protein|nr:MAG: hypothetical protein CVV05_15630 [Gammaproteobacteria bacterium HGW-Gammaproteobacteria-1]
MWHQFRTIKGFMLLAALAGSLLLFAGAYAVVASLYDRTVREDAREVSGVLAGQTFDAMFQVMRKGWTRAELEEFLAAMRGRFADTPYSLEIYRGEIVEARFGPIEQPVPDAAIAQAFRDGNNVVREDGNGLRHVYPLRAREECLGCHTNAVVGDTLGVIDLRQDLRPVLERARAGFMSALWLIVPVMLVGAFLVAMFIHGRIDHSVRLLRGRVGLVNKVSDLANFAMDESQVGFRELDDILAEVRALVTRLREFAVDKDLLEFEIRLLERFIITSEVVRDWREYVNHLLLEINKVMEAYVLFSVFKVEEELFDLEIFWRNKPSPHMTQVLERSVRAVLQRHPYFKGMTTVEVNHNVADSSCDMPSLSEADIELQSKSLFVETPKIGGIVGIGVQAGLGRDPMRLLVMESILSTLLNVVGSVKAIYKYTKELEYYATRDPLTHLYNQRAFWELMEYEMERSQRKDERLGLLMIDLDNFKGVNDTYGHAFGDAFLQSFAELLKQVFRQGDVVARYGGDEFVVLLTDTPENQAWTAAQRLVEQSSQLTLTAPDGKPVRVTVSVGIALCPEHATAARDLFLVADNLMYRAKSEGKNRALLAGSNDIAEIYRGIGAQSFVILAALEEKRFIPYFQPIITTEDGTPFAYEMLSRMQDDTGAVTVAADYIDVAERMGVVHKLDYQVMEHSFEAVRRTGYSGKLFVNLSPRALILAEFVPTVEKLVSRCGINPAQIVFELTERETVRNLALLQSFVSELKLRGFQFAIDDFGSGFSSFHYLKHFPIDYVKIDGDFIINLMHDERDQVFVRHMAAMAHDLGIRTIAEFVEDAEVLQHVRDAGIDYVQGFYIGRPKASLG